jgi:hypothetical protein
MTKDRNTFQKQQREFDKKRKAEDKRKRRQAQKAATLNHKQPLIPGTQEIEDPFVE